MFGLPGAALAMYHCARPEKKNKIYGIMLAGAFASFLTGISEPLEFSFMFVAPPLYFIHAVLTGISVFIAAQMHWIAGFGFSAGLIDMILSSRNPLATDWYMLFPQGVLFFAVYYLMFRSLINKFKLLTPGREEDIFGDEEDDYNINKNNIRNVDILPALWLHQPLCGKGEASTHLTHSGAIHALSVHTLIAALPRPERRGLRSMLLDQ